MCGPPFSKIRRRGLNAKTASKEFICCTQKIMQRKERKKEGRNQDMCVYVQKQTHQVRSPVACAFVPVSLSPMMMPLSLFGGQNYTVGVLLVNSEHCTVCTYVLSCIKIRGSCVYTFGGSQCRVRYVHVTKCIVTSTFARRAFVISLPYFAFLPSDLRIRV